MTGVTRTAVIVLLASALAMPVGSQALTDRSEAARSGAAWLASRQEPDGALPTYGGSGVGEVLVSMLVGGVRGEPVDQALAFIRKNGPGSASGPAKAARIAMGLVAASEDPRSFHGTNYVARINDGYDANTGAYESNVYADALAALGVLAAGDNLPGRAITYLKTNQCATGGWAWRQACAGVPDVDTTAMVMSALLSSGLPRGDDAVSRGRSWLLEAQNADGGFPLEDGGDTNANSTGLALSVIEAMDEDPRSDPWRDSSGDPVEALIELQDDTGGFRFKGSDAKPGDYATVQAVPGLAGVSFPVGPLAMDAPATTPAPNLAAPATDAPGVAASDAPRDRGENRAGVIIMNGRRQDQTFCVTFDEPTITGEQLLERTGSEVVESRTQMGAAVCKIGKRGCPAGDCFCKVPVYWNYWTFDARSKTWKYSDVGAAMRTVDDGAIDAWVWSTGKEPTPPKMTLNQICSAAEPVSRVGGSADPETTRAPGILWPFLGAVLVFVIGGFAVWWRVRKP